MNYKSERTICYFFHNLRNEKCLCKPKEKSAWPETVQQNVQIYNKALLIELLEKQDLTGSQPVIKLP